MPESSEIADYCRQIETYLCQKNEGHLIRVVGPSFDLVARWAADGVPLKVAYRGIDRTIERYYRKGPRRRPVKIDFCAADVLDVFDEWRRATGLTAAEVRGDDERPMKRGPSLVDHLRRVLLRLTNARVSGALDDRADPLIDTVSRELDAAKASRRGVRGDERQALVARLSEADRTLMNLARTVIPPSVFTEIERDVASELAAFETQMPADALQRARDASLDQAVRDRLHLPMIAFSTRLSTPMVTPGDVLSLHIEKPAAGGAMIARADRQVILVSGAIPGERARVRIDRIAKGVAYGSVAEVEEPSPDRRPAFTDPFCGGCLYAHIDYARQTAIKAEVIADAFARIGRMPLQAAVPVTPSPADGYRMRARLHVRRGRLGFFREGSHEVCDARATRQLLPATMDALERTAGLLREHGVNDAELDLSENIEASQRAVHVEPGPGDAAVAVLALPEGLSGLTIARPGHSDLRVERGSDRIADSLSIGGRVLRLERHVLAFFQGNRFLLHAFVEHVVERCAGARTAVDLYAGVGLFSVALAGGGIRVVAVEGDRVAADDLRTNAASVDGMEAIHQPVERFVERRREASDVVLVDPPRTGLSRDALQGVLAIAAPRVVYVSCDVATLARDARLLVEGGYRLGALDAFDLFPNTPHIETVAVFDR